MKSLTPADLELFDAQGYLLVRGAVPVAKCAAVVEAIWDFLGMDPNRPSDWYRPPLPTGGMVEMYHDQTMWNCRQHPGLHAIYAALFGTARLWVSIDRVSLKPPVVGGPPEYDNRGFTHWDTNTRIPHLRRDGTLIKDPHGLNRRPTVPFGVQGVVYLTDTAPDQGGFQCIPGFPARMNEWLKAQPKGRNPHAPNLNGLEVTPIPGCAGDLVIWDRLMPHGNGRNMTDKPRLAQFISMGPEAFHWAPGREARVKCWKENRPPPAKCFPGDPRKIEERRRSPARLTPLGRRLLGLDAWPPDEAG